MPKYFPGDSVVHLGSGPNFEAAGGTGSLQLAPGRGWVREENGDAEEVAFGRRSHSRVLTETVTQAAVAPDDSPWKPGHTVDWAGALRDGQRKHLPRCCRGTDTGMRPWRDMTVVGSLVLDRAGMVRRPRPSPLPSSLAALPVGSTQWDGAGGQARGMLPTELAS